MLRLHVEVAADLVHLALAFVGISAAAGLDRLRSAPVRWRGRSVRLERP